MIGWCNRCDSSNDRPMGAPKCAREDCPDRAFEPAPAALAEPPKAEAQALYEAALRKIADAARYTPDGYLDPYKLAEIASTAITEGDSSSRAGQSSTVATEQYSQGWYDAITAALEICSGENARKWAGSIRSKLYEIQSLHTGHVAPYWPPVENPALDALTRIGRIEIYRGMDGDEAIERGMAAIGWAERALSQTAGDQRQDETAVSAPAQPGLEAKADIPPWTLKEIDELDAVLNRYPSPAALEMKQAPQGGLSVPEGSPKSRCREDSSSIARLAQTVLDELKPEHLHNRTWPIGLYKAVNALRYELDEAQKQDEKESAPAPAAQPGVQPVAWDAGKIYDEIKEVLEHHRLFYWQGEDGDNYYLTDALTPDVDTDISRGKEEIVGICDAIYNEVLLKAAPQSAALRTLFDRLESAASWSEIGENIDDWLKECRESLAAAPLPAAPQQPPEPRYRCPIHGDQWCSCPPLLMKQSELRLLSPEARQKLVDMVLAAGRGEAPQQPAQQEPFQTRVLPWLLSCFGQEIAKDGVERNHRFLEEALELVQSTGCTLSEAHQLVDYVFSRPVGEPTQELGGVMVTLAALALAHGLDMHAAGETELARISDPATMARIRAKQAAKPKHSPLPQDPETLQDRLHASQQKAIHQTPPGGFRG